jgi:hypothetical protein
MGVDLLDLKYRIRQELNVELDLISLFRGPDEKWIRTPPDLTMGELLDGIIRTADRQSVSLPPDVWPILQSIIVKCLYVDAKSVTHDAFLIKDLGAE